MSKGDPSAEKAAENVPVSCKSVCTVNLAGTKAAGADVNRLGRAVNNSLDTSDVGLEHSVYLTVGVRNGASENNTLTADTTLCHETDTSCII